MFNENNKLSLQYLPRELILLIISSLDYQSFLKFRLVSKALEQISRYFFINIAKKKIITDKISCGPSSVFLARANGELWGWGDNSFNQLAMTKFKPSPNGVSCYTPQHETKLKDVDKIAMGYDFSVVVTKNGEVWASGNNSFGELGIGNNEQHTHPQRVSTLTSPTQIAAGNGFALALTKDGLYSWGRNHKGQLGHNNNQNCSTPKIVSEISNVDKIAVGETYSVASTTTGGLFIWGQFGSSKNPTPQLAASSIDIASISAGSNFILTLHNDGKVFTWSNNASGSLEKIQIPQIENIVRISVNSFYDDSCLALSYGGIAYFWHNSDVRSNKAPKEIMGLGKIIEIGQACKSSIVMDENGLVSGWGMNNGGTAGLGEEYFECVSPQKAYQFEEPVKTTFIKNMTRRFTKERFAKALLKSEQKTALSKNLTFFSSKDENQINKEVEELKQVLADEKTSIVQLEDKLNNCLKLFEKDTSKESPHVCLSDMQEELSKLKSIIAKEIKAEAKAEVCTLMMKRT